MTGRRRAGAAPAAWVLPLLLLVACSSAPATDTAASPARAGREAAPRPAWVNAPPEREGDKLVFIGWSRPAPTEAEARDLAFRSALRNYAVYCGVEISDRELLAVHADTLRDSALFEGKTRLRLRALLSGFRAEDWFLERTEFAGAPDCALVSWVKCGVAETDCAEARERMRRRATAPATPLLLVLDDPEDALRAPLAASLTAEGLPIAGTGDAGSRWRLSARFRAERRPPKPAEGRSERTYAFLLIELKAPGSDAVALAFERAAHGLGFSYGEAVRDAISRIMESEAYKVFLDDLRWETGLD